MRSPEHDEIMNAYDDKYEALARMVIGSEGKLFDYDQFKEERQLYKKLTLATVYGTRASAVPSEQPFIDRLTEFLRQCPKYMEYNKRLNDRVDIGLPIAIDSYFGNSQIIAGKYRDVDIINDALNAPVQTGTSEIVALTTMQILEEFYNRGYSEEDISVYYVRHDEPVFRVSEKALKDAWIFNQFNQILIDDWTPLRMDFNFGYYYKQQDEKLENIIKECYKDNANKIVNIKVGNTINNFYPVPPVCSLTVSKTETADNKIVYCLFSEELNGAHYKLLNSKPESEENYVFKIISDLEEQIYRKGYRGILVKASFVNTTESFIGNSYIQLRFVNDNTLSKSQLLSDFMAIKYSIKNKIDYSRISLPYKEDEAFIKTVKDFTDVMK
jgi:transcriptional regulator CtsR